MELKMTKDKLYMYLFEKIGIKLTKAETESGIYCKLYLNDDLTASIDFVSFDGLLYYLRCFSIGFYSKKFQPYVRLFRLFSENIESKEQIDLLLTLNGLNKEI